MGPAVEVAAAVVEAEAEVVLAEAVAPVAVAADLPCQASVHPFRRNHKSPNPPIYLQTDRQAARSPTRWETTSSGSAS